LKAVEQSAMIMGTCYKDDSQPRWKTNDFNVTTKSCSDKKMTNKLFVNHQKVMAI
jgi:hypothetical protein